MRLRVVIDGTLMADWRITQASNAALAVVPERDDVASGNVWPATNVDNDEPL